MGDKPVYHTYPLPPRPGERIRIVSPLRRRVGEAEAIYQILRVANAELKQEPAAEWIDEVVTPLPDGWQHIVRVKR